MERKKFERVKSASSELVPNFLVRQFTRAVHRCCAVPQLLDVIQFEFIDRTRQKPSDIKKLLIPDCIEN